MVSRISSSRFRIKAKSRTIESERSSSLFRSTSRGFNLEASAIYKHSQFTREIIYALIKVLNTWNPAKWSEYLHPHSFWFLLLSSWWESLPVELLFDLQIEVNNTISIEKEVKLTNKIWIGNIPDKCLDVFSDILSLQK